jgi:hypothetical protein
VVPTGGGSAHLGGATAGTSGGSARTGLRGGKIEQQRFIPVGAGGSTCVGAAPGATARSLLPALVATARVVGQ